VTDESELPPEDEAPLPEEERLRRADRANADMRTLMRAAILLGAVGVGAAATAAALGVPGARLLAHGLAVGSLVAILNLRVLARAIWALTADKDLPRALLGFGASFTLLSGSAAYVAFAHPHLVLGFALGLALPAPAGVWFGLRLQQDPDAD
jgi:hypothetical protein